MIDILVHCSGILEGISNLTALCGSTYFVYCYMEISNNSIFLCKLRYFYSLFCPFQEKISTTTKWLKINLYKKMSGTTTGSMNCLYDPTLFPFPLCCVSCRNKLAIRSFILSSYCIFCADKIQQRS